jgi:hypothetical protein
MSGRPPRIAPHESAGSGEPPPLPSNRYFGLAVGGVLIALGVLMSLSREPGPASAAVLGAGALLAGLAAVAPALLEWPNRLWMKLGLVLGLIMTPVVMGVVYVTTFLPIGLIMRLRGHDPLKRKRKPAGESYWIVRNPPGPDPATMPNQF